MHPKHVRGVQFEDAYTQYNTPPGHEPDSDGLPGTSNAQGEDKPGTDNPSSGDDDEDNSQIYSDLLNIWTQRLQVLTAVTTFLASMDGEMFSLTALNTQISLPISMTYRQMVYSCLSGALIFHICASILGFIASFALTRYRIVEDISKVRAIQSFGLEATQPAQRPSRKILVEAMPSPRWLVKLVHRTGRLHRFLTASQSTPASMSSPLSTLMHCYYTTLCLAGAGFLLALTGILTYIWAGLPMPVGVFSTVCLGLGISAIVWAVAL